MTRKFFLTRAGALGAVAALALTACGSQTTQTGQNAQTSPSASTSASATPAPITEGKGRGKPRRHHLRRWRARLRRQGHEVARRHPQGRLPAPLRRW